MGREKNVSNKVQKNPRKMGPTFAATITKSKHASEPTAETKQNWERMRERETDKKRRNRREESVNRWLSLAETFRYGRFANTDSSSACRRSDPNLTSVTEGSQVYSTHSPLTMSCGNPTTEPDALMQREHLRYVLSTSHRIICRQEEV